MEAHLREHRLFERCFVVNARLIEVSLLRLVNLNSRSYYTNEKWQVAGIIGKLPLYELQLYKLFVPPLIPISRVLRYGVDQCDQSIVSDLILHTECSLMRASRCSFLTNVYYVL